MDVTLVTADNQQISAHRVILCQYSPFLNNILLNNSHQNPLLYFHDVYVEDFTAILQYMYTGHCLVKPGGIQGFTTLVRILQISGIYIDENIKNMDKGNERESILDSDKVTGELSLKHSLLEESSVSGIITSENSQVIEGEETNYFA